MSKKAVPFKFLLECSDGALGNFELVKLGEAANLRREMLALFDRLVDVSAQAVLAAWLRTLDRNELRQQLLESPNTTFEAIIAEAKAQIRSQGHPEEERGEMPSPWLVRPMKYHTKEERKAANIAATGRRQEERVTKGLCEKCSEPQCRESSRLCKKHLDMKTANQRKRNGTKEQHGRHPNTLKALREPSEKRKRKARREADATITGLGWHSTQANKAADSRCRALFRPATRAVVNLIPRASVRQSFRGCVRPSGLHQ